MDLPNYMNLQKASSQALKYLRILFTFSVKSVDNYTGIIRPSGVIDKSLIKAEERGILWVLLSLLLQENTQSIIVKKINSSARYGRLKKAFFEYNKI